MNPLRWRRRLRTRTEQLVDGQFPGAHPEDLLPVELVHKAQVVAESSLRAQHLAADHTPGPAFVFLHVLGEGASMTVAFVADFAGHITWKKKTVVKDVTEYWQVLSTLHKPNSGVQHKVVHSSRGSAH